MKSLWNAARNIIQYVTVILGITVSISILLVAILILKCRRIKLGIPEISESEFNRLKDIDEEEVKELERINADEALRMEEIRREYSWNTEKLLEREFYARTTFETIRGMYRYLYEGKRTGVYDEYPKNRQEYRRDTVLLIGEQL